MCVPFCFIAHEAHSNIYFNHNHLCTIANRSIAETLHFIEEQYTYHLAPNPMRVIDLQNCARCLTLNLSSHLVSTAQNVNIH